MHRHTYALKYLLVVWITAAPLSQYVRFYGQETNENSSSRRVCTFFFWCCLVTINRGKDGRKPHEVLAGHVGHLRIHGGALICLNFALLMCFICFFCLYSALPCLYVNTHRKLSPNLEFYIYMIHYCHWCRICSLSFGDITDKDTVLWRVLPRLLWSSHWSIVTIVFLRKSYSLLICVSLW